MTQIVNPWAPNRASPSVHSRQTSPSGTFCCCLSKSQMGALGLQRNIPYIMPLKNPVLPKSVQIFQSYVRCS